MKTMLSVLALFLFVGVSLADDPVAEHRAKFLGALHLASPTSTVKAPFNWCHCGDCFIMAEAKDDALAQLSGAKCPTCDGDSCPCPDGVCPECDQFVYPTWETMASDPGRLYLHASLRGQPRCLCGGWDTVRKYWRSYDAKADTWGPAKDKPPVALPASPVATRMPASERIESPYQVIQYGSSGSGGCSAGSFGSSGGIIRVRYR